MKNKFFALLCLLFFCATLHAQSKNNPFETPEENPDLPLFGFGMPVPEAEQEGLEETEDSEPKETDFILIVEAKHQHILNPQITSYSSDSQILTGLYEGLFTYHPVTLEPQYALATDYKISRDKKRITFTVRENAFFSNGDKITANDVKKSWLKLLATPNAPYASMLDIIRGAEDFRKGKASADSVGLYVTDDYHLAVYLNTPANYLPKVLCHSSFSIINDDMNVYSGPYTVYYQEESSLVMKKNPYYWDKNNTKTEYLIFEQCSDAMENTFNYNAGIASWVDADYMADKVIDKNAMQMNAEFGTSYYFFKQSCKKPEASRLDFNPWDYEEFRNAIIEVFPWEVFRTTALVPAETLVFPLTGYPEIQGFNYTDVIEAKAKMEAARKKYGVKDDVRFTLTVEVSEYAINEMQATALREQLALLNVDLVVRKLPSYVYLANVSKSDADLFFYSWIGDFADPLAFLMLFQTGSTLNDSGWSNKDFDALLDKAAGVSDVECYELLAKAEVILLDSGMILPILHPVAFNLIDVNEVGGWATNAFNIHPLKYLYKKTTRSTVPNIVMR